jgi:hypothetical protein
MSDIFGYVLSWATIKEYVLAQLQNIIQRLEVVPLPD